MDCLHSCRRLLTTDPLAAQVQIPETNASVELFLFDCAGQSIFNQKELSAKYWENTAFVMCVYDVSNRESFQSVQKWHMQVRSVRQTSSGGALPGVLVANKVDLREGGINARAVVDSQEVRHSESRRKSQVNVFHRRLTQHKYHTTNSWVASFFSRYRGSTWRSRWGSNISSAAHTLAETWTVPSTILRHSSIATTSPP